MQQAACATIADRRRAFCKGSQPEPSQTVAEYADACIKLPSSASEPDQWRTSRTPFLKEIMECLSPRHRCHKVVAQKPIQIGMTTTAVIWACFTIDRSPTPMLFFEPDIDLAKDVVKDKIDPIIDATPAMRGKVKQARSRASGNTTFRKDFLGGSLKMKWASSSAAARSASAERIVLDEVDEYEADIGRKDNKQGHPCDLIENRAATYPRYKIFELSTPTEEETSRIEPQYLAGSQGRYHVPCPYCGHLQHLVWERLLYTFDGVKRPEDAAYQCEACLRLIEERYKTWMMDSARAKWVHAYPERLNQVASFHLNLLYQPYGWAYPWSRLAKDYIDAYAKLKAGDTGPMKVFTNTKLAKTWKVEVDKVESVSLYQRREIYESPMPREVVLLTAAVDVQDNRLEAELVGWGLGEESWSLDYCILQGSPGSAQVWMALTEWLLTPHLHPSGVTLRIEGAGVDTGGHYTQQAYEFVERYRGVAFAFKGSSTDGAPAVPKREPNRFRKRRFKLYLLGTTALKDTVFARLKLNEPGPGYMHFPRHDGYDDDYFKGLTSEVKKPKYKPRTAIRIGWYYDKEYSRNEPLDLKAMNLAVLMLLTSKRKLTDWAKRIANHVPQLELPVEAEPVPVPAPVRTPEPPAAKELTDKAGFVTKTQPFRRPKGNFVKGWR